MRVVTRIFPILIWVLLSQWPVFAQQDAELRLRVDGLWYMPNRSEPYTGKAARAHFDGTKISVINYRAGKQHGLTRFWYNNGNLRSSFNYIDGQLDGNATYYYRNGNIQNLTMYQGGLKHGLTVDWWPEGKKSFEENYVKGFPEGRWLSWWPKGKLASEKVYRNRRLLFHREWTKDGMPKSLPGWNLDGSLKTVATNRQRMQLIGRRMLWNRVSGANRIDLIYRDNSLHTIRTVFGDPDDTDDNRWTYKGLRIQDPANGRMYDTAIFGFKKGKVSEIWIE